MKARIVLVAVIVVCAPCLGLSQTFPSPNCSVSPLAEITPLPFSSGGTGGYADDVELGVDFGDACLGGSGSSGVWVDGSHDFVYQLTLGPGHSVNCTFNAIGADYAVVLTSNCADPVSFCYFGQIATAGGSVLFDTQILGMPPGTYYLWADGTIGAAWSLNCSGTLPVSIESLGVE